jgi:hypothetical protein
MARHFHPCMENCFAFATVCVRPEVRTIPTVKQSKQGKTVAILALQMLSHSGINSSLSKETFVQSKNNISSKQVGKRLGIIIGTICALMAEKKWSHTYPPTIVLIGVEV